MNILKKLTIKNLKLNKKRTISTIIGIILSCALICAVSTMVTSFKATLVENAVNETGYYHIKIADLNQEEIEKLKNNRDIKQIYTVEEKGYGILENSQNQFKPYLKLFSMNMETFENLNFNLVEGNFPSNSNEVIISKHIIDNGGVHYEIGDKIKIDIGERVTLDGYKLNSSNMYSKNEEKLIQTQEFEFTIVGIIERPGYGFEYYSDAGYTIISTNMNSNKKEAYIALKNPKEYKTVIPNIMGVDDYVDVEYYQREDAQKLNYENFKINDELLRWEVMAFSNSTVSMLYAVAGVVIFIIIFTSVYCIRNSFAIAVTEKQKLYGMLASVGATKKQIKKNVVFEALILGLIGIPIGILSGIFAVFVLLKIVNSLLGEYLLSHVDGITMSVSAMPILISVVLGTITIYLSAISSAKRASRVEPIKSLRNSEDIKINSKKLKTPKIISKLFKTGGVLAYKNLKRSKKKYRTTVISLAVSISIFIAMNSFLVNMFGLTENYYEDYDYNILAYLRGQEPETIDKMKQLKNIDEYFILYSSDESLKISDLSKINNQNVMLEEIGEKNQVALQIKALDDITFRKFAKKIGANYEKVKDKGILCDKYLSYNEVTDKQTEERTYTYKVGETITGKYKEQETGIKVGYISSTKPYGIENSYYYGGYLVVNLDTCKNINFIPEYMSIQSSNTQELIDEMDIASINVGYANFEEAAKEEKAMVLVIKIFLYGFIAVITLIGVTNIFNTITSNIELRQKEFAMLKSIGMTKKEFNQMINLETIFYSTKSLIIGITLGLLETFAMYKAFSIKIEKSMYIPEKPIIISAIAVFVLVFIIMKYSTNKVNKQNTIETMRNDNI